MAKGRVLTTPHDFAALKKGDEVIFDIGFGAPLVEVEDVKKVVWLVDGASFLTADGTAGSWCYHSGHVRTTGVTHRKVIPSEYARDTAKATGAIR